MAVIELDYLTDLPNRKSLYQHYLELPQDSTVHAMFLDVDNFKKVNDIYGHNMGDQLLVGIADFLQEVLEGCFIARIGGDEFAVILPAEIQAEDVPAIAELLLSRFKEMDFRQDVMSLVSLSIGALVDNSVSEPLDDILAKCDAAMYHAKNNGKNRYTMYDQLNSVYETNRRMEAEMEDALKNGEIQVFFQPKMNMVTSQMYGAEALSRWVHPEEGILVPKMYMELFEKNGFVVKLDYYIFEEVCRLKQSWQGKRYANIPVSVNMSRLHLYDREFPEHLEEIVKKYKVNISELELEFAERAFAKDSEELIEMMERLREKGFQVSIDDFGTGYSSLSMLTEVPADIVKLDKDFLKNSASDVARGMLKNVIRLIKDNRMAVVCEGVEIKEQAEFLNKAGCDIGQGFFFSRPIPVKEFEATYLQRL